MAAQLHSVALAGNGYVYPEETSNGYGTITSDGPVNWTNRAGFTRVFFYPQQTGRIDVMLTVKAPEAANTVSVQLDSSGVTHNVAVPKSPSYAALPAGAFDITTVKYHYIEIKAVTDNGTFLPDVQAVVVYGAAAAGLKYNNGQSRSAASTYFNYETPPGNSIAWFYNEIYIPAGANPVNAYYVANGFKDGYFGIQVNSATERRVLFSIWSNFQSDNPNDIPPDYAVTLVKKGIGVETGTFENEGSGGQSYWRFTWKTDTTYKLLVHAEAVDDHTLFTGYFFVPESNSWKLMARWDKSKTGGQLLNGLYSFVENFGSNGNDSFKAYYTNQWVCHTDGTWVELTEANFSNTASPTTVSRYDYGSGTSGAWMYMFSGGFKQVNNLTDGSKVQRIGSGPPPAINFNTLPIYY